MDLLKNFRKKLEAGSTVFGIFMKTCDPAFVEITGNAGLDFVILDMEHGPVSFESLQNLIRGAVVAGIVPIVRTPDDGGISIGKVLDLGAMGVQVPQIRNEEEIRIVISAARFHPEGERGVCRYVRAADYSSKPPKEYFKDANKALVIAQLEGTEALNNLDKILKVEGIDILFVGPYDLSQSLGYPGETNHPDVIGAMKLIVEKARSKGKVLGTFTNTLDAAHRWKKTGVQYISHSVDTGIFTVACKKLADDLSAL